MTFCKNMKNITLLSISMLALTSLVSCGSDTSNDERQQLARQLKASANESALVSVSRFTVEGVTEDKTSMKSRIAYGKTFHVKACLSSKLGKSLQYQTFYVSGENFQTVERTADNNSCIFWDEPITMDYSLPNTYLPMGDRVITLATSANISYDLKLSMNQYTNSIIHRNNYVMKTSLNKSRLSSDEIINVKNVKITPKGFGQVDPRNDNLIIDQKVVVNGCLNLKANGSSLSNEFVKARLINLEKQENGEEHAVTEMYDITDGQLDESGCGEIKFYLEHERYTNTRRIPFNLEIEVQNETLQNAKVTRGLCLYPWSNNGWIFAEVSRTGKCEKDNNNQRARLFVDEVNYSFLGHDNNNGFHLNKNLDLVIEKSFIVKMYPKVNYGNYVHHMNPIEPFYQGKLKLEVYFLAPLQGDIDLTNENKHKFKLISVASREVDVENNLLKARIDMPIKFVDMPYIHTRTYAAIKLSPILREGDDPRTAPRPAWAAGTFHASSKTFHSILHTQLQVTDEFEAKDYTNTKITKKMTEMVQLESYLEKLSNDVKGVTKKDIIAAKLAPRYNKSSEAIFSDELKKHELFDETIKVDHIGLNKKLIEENKLTASELSKLYEDQYDAATLAKLCGSFFSQEKTGLIWKTYSDYNMRKCIESPWEFMMITPVSHVQEILSKPRVSHSNTIRISKSTGSGTYFTENRRVGFSHGYKTGVGAKLDFKIPFGESSPVGGGVGVSAGYDWSTSWSLDKSNGDNNRSDNGQSIDLYAEAITLNFEARTHQCFMIEGTSKFKAEWVGSQMYGSGNHGLGGSLQYVAVNNPIRYKVCKPKAGKERLEETWYFTGEGFQFNSILRDRLGMTENQYTMMFRGRKTLYKFTDFLSKASSSMFNIKERKTQSPDVYMLDVYKNYKEAFDSNHDLIDDQAIPGTVEKYDPIKNGGDHNFSEDNCELPPDEYNHASVDFC
ncbi:hypothetical protein [Halobacteriovorax sp. ZH4_bin.1]|uniref:hypothetical protein n=1 Tax=unclassified Halobacteriovorax TaxID=2639665 RepID=UPI00371401F8